MRYGYFDRQQREYVVERPDTPWPWINYLGDDEYCAIISNNAGGYSFYRSAGENRLLRYRFNAVPCDQTRTVSLPARCRRPASSGRIPGRRRKSR